MSTRKASNKPPAQQSKPKSSDLAPLLRHFVGINLIVETKHGSSFHGQLVEADAYMNLVLARDTTKRGGNTNEISFDRVHIRGPSIRYIVFGPNVDIVKQIREGRDRERSAGDRYRRGVRKSK
jgi:small nuclear ribonucleoprotein (snRNP)-like protein